MDSVFVSNENVQLVLIPKNELERQLLTRLLDKELDLEQVLQPISILGQSVKDAVIIRPKSMNQHASETETM